MNLCPGHKSSSTRIFGVPQLFIIGYARQHPGARSIDDTPLPANGSAIYQQFGVETRRLLGWRELPTKRFRDEFDMQH